MVWIECAHRHTYTYIVYWFINSSPQWNLIIIIVLISLCIRISLFFLSAHMRVACLHILYTKVYQCRYIEKENLMWFILSLCVCLYAYQATLISTILSSSSNFIYEYQGIQDTRAHTDSTQQQPTDNRGKKITNDPTKLKQLCVIVNLHFSSNSNIHIFYCFRFMIHIFFWINIFLLEALRWNVCIVCLCLYVLCI